jgi:hypothetical protein
MSLSRRSGLSRVRCPSGQWLITVCIRPRSFSCGREASLKTPSVKTRVPCTAVKPKIEKYGNPVLRYDFIRVVNC